MIRALLDYFRVPGDLLGETSLVTDTPHGDCGFFQFGPGNPCYGKQAGGAACSFAGASQFDAINEVRQQGNEIHVPFDLTEVVDNLRLERYRQRMVPAREVFASTQTVRKLYYLVRECLPVSFRRELQKAYFRDWKDLPFPAWPVDFSVDNLHSEFLRMLMQLGNIPRVPFIWFWPDGAPNCVMMTHDVETSAGRDFTFKLIDLDDSFGIKSSFQVIPEKRYEVPDEYVQGIRSRGCEFNIHDLNHDGNLYRHRDEFIRRAARINGYVRKYNVEGFRAGAMYRNQEWYDVFEFSYDMSVPNVAHLEPLRGGCCTVMPYFIGKIVELPLTAAQDYSLFHILNDYSIDLWKRQLAMLKERNGMMSFIAHPDYLIDRRARAVYEALLNYLREMISREKIWAPLPGEINHWWRARSQMKLIPLGNGWGIEGPSKERARVAYAVLDQGRLRYELA